jgi:hypothetical protein
MKFRYRLGYESLCREVTDSIAWRRFCRIALDGAVPHPKLNTRCGSAAVEGLNEALLAKAAEAKVLRTNLVRADTTVTQRMCPTDRGECAADLCCERRACRRALVTRWWLMGRFRWWVIQSSSSSLSCARVQRDVAVVVQFADRDPQPKAEPICTTASTTTWPRCRAAGRKTGRSKTRAAHSCQAKNGRAGGPVPGVCFRFSLVGSRWRRCGRRGRSRVGVG